jgi:MFS transporter, FSR family, fosmidomycin resistance protein
MKMNLKALVILSAGHMVADFNQGALPILLPFFKESLHLSYTTAGIILLFGNLTSSVIQPAFGYLSDRRFYGWVLPLSPLIACLGLSVTGFITSYPLLLACVVVMGFGVASYHPEGFKTAHFFTGEKKATGMSFFQVGGNLGVAVGPILALALVTRFGMKGTIGMVLPGAAMGIILLLFLSQLTTPVKNAYAEKKKSKAEPLSRRELTSLVILISLVTVRSWIQLGLVSYIPFYYIDYLKGDPLYAGKLVSTFLLAGAFGTLVGAPLADRWGHKRFVLITLFLMFPLLLLFYNSTGWWSFIFVGISGMVLVSSFSTTVVMAQVILPHHLGMVSGLMVGFAIGAGGVGVTFLGTIADAWGVPMAMKTILATPLLTSFLVFLLEYPPKKQ